MKYFKISNLKRKCIEHNHSQLKNLVNYKYNHRKVENTWIAKQNKNKHVQKMPSVARNIDKRRLNLYTRDVQDISILVLARLSETIVHENKIIKCMNPLYIN